MDPRVIYQRNIGPIPPGEQVGVIVRLASGGSWYIPGATSVRVEGDRLVIEGQDEETIFRLADVYFCSFQPCEPPSD